jgi:predicted unusual protein kinase regulating ubiquinone biosynthesis (AarF/ABC1/UbiB family)
MAPKEIPKGRVRRTATLASAVSSGGAKVASAAALDRVGRGGDGERLLRSHLEAAQKMVEVLGSMKGAAMKIGQLASFLEIDFIPEEFRPLYQEQLAALRDAAPAMDFAEVEKVLREEWDGDRVGEHFAELEGVAAAAASVGQVHRGVLHDGRVVAVKVQYPGVDEAIRADLQNVGLITTLAKAIAPGLDARAVAGEIRERVSEEMDYELEAQNQRRFARAYRGHPFIFVPEVVTDLSRRRVLVSDWVEGEDFDAVKAQAVAIRDRVGEIIYRFGYGAMYHVGYFNADPHPGNYRLLGDVRVAFLDFGSVKAMAPERLARMAAVFEAAMTRDAESFRDVLVELGYLGRPDRVLAERLIEHVWAIAGWFLADRELTVDAKLVEGILSAQSDPRAGYFDVIRKARLPAEDVMFRRLEIGLVAILGQLRATGNWHRMAREILFEDPPATPLGEAEWAFWGRRGSLVEKFWAIRRGG